MMKKEHVYRGHSLAIKAVVIHLFIFGLLALSAVASPVRKKENAARRFTKIKTKKNAPLPARYKGLLKRLPMMESEEVQEKFARNRENPEARKDWFMFQRTFPNKTTPPDARRLAWEAVANRGAELSAEADTLTWRALGPMPSRSLYFDSNWGALSGRINAIAVSPADPQLILVGGATGGVWRSTDGGKNFTPVSDDQVDLAVGYIAFAPSNPNIVYAGMGDAHGFYFGSGVLKSTDAGKTWKRISNATFPTPGGVHKVVVDPTNADRVYVALFFDRFFGPGGVFVSSDGGVNWKAALPGYINDVALNPANAQTVYATVSFPADPSDPDSPTEGIYQSTDSGQTWKQIYTSPYFFTFDFRVALSPANPQIIYGYLGGILANNDFGVRVVVSKDSGATWKDLGGKGLDAGQFGYNTYLAVDPKNADSVFIGTRDVFRSDNGGTTWKNLNGNFTADDEYQPDLSNTHPDQHAIAFASNGTIYFGNDGGLYKSANRGATFESLNNSLTLTQFVAYTLHPTNPLISYGGTQDNGTQRRLKGGREWQDFIGGDGGKVIINPANPSEVFTTIYYGLGVKAGENGDLLPEQFTTYPELFGQDFADGDIGFYPPFVGNGVNNKLYFGSWRLFISNDFGDTWYTPGWRRDLTYGAPPGQRADVLNAIGVARANTDVIYTGSQQGRVMVTQNAGNSWTDITRGLPNRTITDIVVDRTAPGTAFVTLSGYLAPHVFKTTDYGTTWRNLSAGLPDIPANTLLVDPKDSNTLYLGTDIGVFRSTNGGAQWQYFNNGLPPVIVISLVAQDSGLIQAGTYGRGAYELTVSTGNAQEN